MNLETPQEFHGSVADAYHQALQSCTPVLCPAEIYTDQRGWSIMNQLKGVLRPEGQVNFSLQNPGVVKAWHRHQKQTDFWLCIRGCIQVGVHREQDGVNWSATIDPKRPGVVIIPPTLWHGAATIGSEPAGLLYYVTCAYDPECPDEQRRSHDSVPGFLWKASQA